MINGLRVTQTSRDAAQTTTDSCWWGSDGGENNWQHVINLHWSILCNSHFLTSSKTSVPQNMFKYSWMGVVVFTTIGRKSTWCKSRSRTYSWLKFYSCYAGNGNEYKLWSIFTSSFVVCPGSYSRDVQGVKRIWPPEGNIPLPWIKLEISLGFEHWISNFTKMVWKSVLQILHQHTLASRTPCPGWTTQPWLVHSVQVFSQSLLTGISIPGNKPALFFMLGPIGDIDMNPRSLHVNYCWIMWPLCLISITHTHTHKHTHVCKHTAIPVPNTNSQTFRIVM